MEKSQTEDRLEDELYGISLIRNIETQQGRKIEV